MSLSVTEESRKTVKPLEPQQILKAAAALVRHLEKQRDETKVEKPSLLADDDEENQNSRLDVPLWLLLTAKQHLATSHSLQPGKVPVPHPIYSSPSTQICLISADPPKHNEKAYKNLVRDKRFPKDLGAKIKKVIAFTKLSKKYKSYESRRQLLAEYDLFLVDDRVARLLPAALGKIFYSSATKRPIPVPLTGKEMWGKKQKKTALERLKPKNRSPPVIIGKPEDVGQDIEKALATIPIHLSPSPTLSIKVAYAAWPPEWIADNVTAVVERAVTKYVPSKWAGLKSLYLKGPNTAALPVWMADELWQDEHAVLNPGQKETGINMTKRTKEERQKRKQSLEQRKQKRLQDMAVTSPETKKRKLDDKEAKGDAVRKKSKKTEQAGTAEKAKLVRPPSDVAPATQKRKHDDPSEDDEEFEAAQRLHSKLKAKKGKAPTVVAANAEPTTRISKGKASKQPADVSEEQADELQADEIATAPVSKRAKKTSSKAAEPTRPRSSRNKTKT